MPQIINAALRMILFVMLLPVMIFTRRKWQPQLSASTTTLRDGCRMSDFVDRQTPGGPTLKSMMSAAEDTVYGTDAIGNFYIRMTNYRDGAIVDTFIILGGDGSYIVKSVSFQD